MLIAIDIDQVLADTLAAYLPYHNKKYGADIKIEDCNSYDWWTPFCIKPEQFIADWHEFNIGGCGAAVKPIAGAVKGISQIAVNHNLVAVTARSADIAGETEEWLNLHFPGKFRDIAYTRPVVLQPETESKSQICRRLGAVVLIDDCFEYVAKCVEEGIKVMLYDWPWNRNVLLPKMAVRVYDWEDIAEKLDNPKI